MLHEVAGWPTQRIGSTFTNLKSATLMHCPVARSPGSRNDYLDILCTAGGSLYHIIGKLSRIVQLMQRTEFLANYVSFEGIALYLQHELFGTQQFVDDWTCEVKIFFGGRQASDTAYFLVCVFPQNDTNLGTQKTWPIVFVILKQLVVFAFEMENRSGYGCLSRRRVGYREQSELKGDKKTRRICKQAGVYRGWLCASPPASFALASTLLRRAQRSTDECRILHNNNLLRHWREPSDVKVSVWLQYMLSSR